MRIACPQCSAEYEVPDSLLATGPRLLRCARCSHQFQAQAERADVAAAPSVAPPPPEVVTPPEPPVVPPPHAAEQPPSEPPQMAPQQSPPVTEPAAAAAPRGGATPRFPDPPPLFRPPEEPAPRGGAPLVLAWLLSFALLGAAGWAGWRYQAEVVAAWPPAERLYQAVGMR